MDNKITTHANSPLPENRDMLRDLWRRRLDTLIVGIANADPYYQQIANAAEHISAEYQGRFLIELIQNANDQAVRAGLRDSVVSITRTNDLIAVGNSGQPFDWAKVDAITSIFKSDKSADECIGNKGIGFKAVFQVADSAEIFSSGLDSNLSAGRAIAFHMVRKPFATEAFVAEIRAMACDLLQQHTDRRRDIEERFPGHPAVDVVLRECSKSAWFTFPLPSSEEHFQLRVKQLGLTEGFLRGTQTLVVLPLASPQQLSDRLAAAIDEFQTGDGRASGIPPGASFLFLPGITKVNVDDRVRGFRTELLRREITSPEKIVGGIVVRRHKTTSRHFNLAVPDEEPATTSQEWWVITRVVGDREADDQVKADAERAAIRASIQSLRLPEENWKDVEEIPVSVALPDPVRGDDDEATSLGAVGHFCIGLPTLVQTGSPLWVSSHFHGKIDRTAIDFASDFNRLLFDASVDLAVALLNRLKCDDNKSTLRLVTLAMERAAGALADAFYAEKGVAHTEIVLGHDGMFMEASELAMPKASDLALFDSLCHGITNLATYGFRLPDRMLLLGARAILDGLAQDTVVEDTQYLHRPPELPSLIEHAAKHHRMNGPVFWEPFLTWILNRFVIKHREGLDSQQILPIGSNDLASPKSRVFFPPVSTTVRPTDSRGTPQAVDDAGDELASIGETIAPLLKLFDESAIKVRSGTGRDYTPLAQRLAPATGGALIRQPRQIDLINDALIPALKESRSDNDRALALLRQALTWLVGMSAKAKQRVLFDELLVPVRGPGEAWEWVEPATAYLGEGWADDVNIQLLTKAFGSRPSSQLVSWQRFEKKALHLFHNADREWWSQRMREIGVWDCPRILQTDRRMMVAQSDSYTELTPYTWVRCPMLCSDDLWKDYLTAICKRSANTKSGQEFYLKKVVWIDGLENAAIRETVVEAILRNADRYEPYVSTEICRREGEDSKDIASLWIYTMRVSTWAVVPTSHGLRRPNACWFLPFEIRGAKSQRFSFLPCVKAEFSQAKRLLAQFGVVTVEDAPISRLVSALHELANHIARADSESLRQIGALATDLYEAVQGRLRNKEETSSLKHIVDAPVPLFRTGQIQCANLKEIDKILVDDDNIRRLRVRGFSDSWVLPKRFDETYSNLVDALRVILGEDKVVRVSECPIDVDFQPLEQGTMLIEYLRAQYPGHALEEDIGLLIVKGGVQITSPNKDSFRQAWSRIAQTRLIRGAFRGISPPRACFDASQPGGPMMMVGARLEPHDIVAEMWQLIGVTYRDTWGAYSQALASGSTKSFFEDHGVTLAERTEVEAAIGVGFGQRLGKYQPICLAHWHRSNFSHNTDEFHDEWNRNARTEEAARSWLAWADLAAQIELAAQREEPTGSLFLLEKLELSVKDWQDARRELGAPTWTFDDSVRTYNLASRAIAGHLMAWFAYLVVPRASGRPGPTVSPDIADSIHQWIERIRQEPVPSTVSEDRLVPKVIIACAARKILQLAPELASEADLTVLLQPLSDLSNSAPTELASISLKDEPGKAATVYERDEPAQRASQAVAAVDTILKVACALAEKLGETIDGDKIRKEQLVVLLSQGVWANRVSVLAATRYALENAAPSTAARMKERQAFRDLDDWRTLWLKFEELGEIPKSPTLPPLQPKFDVLGTKWTQEEFDTSAKGGPGGELVQILANAIDPDLDLAELRDTEREEVQTRIKTTRKHKAARGSRRERVPEEYLLMLGATGEYFLFKQLQAVCPQLDVTNWRSKAREFFGFDEGDDSLGYDFEYEDVGGLLSGRADEPRCLIEVKSSAYDGGDSFEMSTNEWEVAQTTHLAGGNMVYVIIRIANVASKPVITDLLIDPIELHLNGVLDYSSRDLLVAVGKVVKEDG
jgi:hypothetical protein